MRPYALTIGILTALVLFVAAPARAQLQRVPNTTLAMPATPPTFGYTSSNAFPNLTFANPVAIVSPPGETNRLFIVGKNGVISVITNLAAPTQTTFIDLTARVTSTTANSGVAGEQGLLSLAFDPGYVTNKYFYVFYTGQATNGTGSAMLHHFLSRFKFTAGNTNQGDSTSETYLYVQYKRAQNHNGGDILFGPDGYLYVSVGDEGQEYDVYTNAQHITWRLWSGILRLDVDKIDPLGLPPNTNSDLSQIYSKTTNYFIPHDNPFVGATTFDGQAINANNVQTEFWAVGLRNPWRMFFDPLTANLYCADVGQDQFEEADIITKGGNYGWSRWEGTNTPPSGVSTAILNATPTPVNPINPFVTYAHGSGPNIGNAIIGGPVYRGQKLPQLYGNYIFGDYVDGNIWAIPAAQAVSLTQTNGTITPPTPILTDGSAGISAFGVDPRNGDVLYTSMNSSIIKRIVYNTVTNGAPIPPTLYDTGAFTNLMSLASPLDALQPAPGIIPYTINVPFWSDNAIKSRWISVPNANLTIGFNLTGNWSFPTGTVWIKHFNLELTNGDPTSEIRLETRLLVKNAAGVYGVTYRWGGSRTNATLVPATGMDENFVINNGGILSTQTWHYPAQTECLTCHTTAGGYGLGTRTEQLNCPQDYGAGPTNQLQALSAAGYFSSQVTNDPSTLLALASATNTSASLEFRSRSFLMANCSQCHQPGGTAQQANWDARITTPTALAGLINGLLVNNLGNPNNHVITPTLPVNSVLLTRDSTRDLGASPSLQMPPLDSNLVDTQATNLISQWILSLTNTFWLGAAPDPQMVTPSSSANYNVTFLATSDYTGNVTLAVSGLPSGANAAFNPAVVSPSATNSTLTITTTGSTPLGSYPLIVTGTDGTQTSTDTMTLVVSSIVTSPAAAGTLVWTAGSGTDTNWSTPLNWTNVTVGGHGTPGSSNDLKFVSNGTTAANPGIINNSVNLNLTVDSLAYTNTSGFETTLIQPGVTLAISVNPAVSGSGNNQGGLTVGGPNLGSSLIAATNIITGAGGTLTITNGDLVVAQGAGQTDAHNVVLDLSGLDTFIMNTPNAGWVAVGGGAYNGTSSARACGTLYLAKTNYINTRYNFRIGNVGTANAPTASIIYLGQTNSITTGSGTDVSVGYTGGTNLLLFKPGLINPTAYFRSSLAPPRVPTWNVAVSSSAGSCVGTNDFGGGTIDVMAGDLQLGRAASTTTTALGVLTFSGGTFNVNTIEAGEQTVSAGGTGVGILNVNSNGTLVVNSTLTLSQVTGTLTAGTLGALNISHGGTVWANGIVGGGGTATITLNSGNLTLTNTASALTSLNLTNSTLHLNLNGSTITTNLITATLTAGGVNTLVIDSVANVTGFTTFPLISYTGTAPAAGSMVKGSLPAGFAANLVNNTTQKRIDLIVAPAAKVMPRIYLLNLAGTNVVIGGSNGFPNSYYYVLASTNLLTPASQWLPISTNPFDLNGAFNFTNPMSPNALQLFYLMQLQ